MNRISRNCETCGGPLPANSKGKTIVCQYCGSIYENVNYDPSIVENTPTILNEIPQPPVEPYHANTQSIQSKSPNKIIISIVTFALICIVGLIFFNAVKKTPDGRLKSLVNSKPTMLTSLPNGEYAGTAVPYKDWELLLSPEIKIDESIIGFKLVVVNWNTSSQVLRFKPNDFLLYDDIGNIYPLRLGNCPEDSGYVDKQISFDAFEQKQFSSNDYWCSDSTDLPVFFGTIPVNAKHLYLQLSAFGVFSKITFVFNL